MHAFYEPRGESGNGFMLNVFHRLRFPAHLHDSFEILFLLKGEMMVAVNGESLKVSPGDAVVMLPNDIHCYDTPDSSKGVLLIFPGSFLQDGGVLFDKKTLKSHLLSFPDSGIEEFCRGFSGGQPFRDYEIAGYVNTLFGKILRRVPLVEKPPENRDLLRKILLFIGHEYDSGMNLNDAAARLGVCRTSISRILKSKTGCGFSEYAGMLRAEKAKRLLSRSGLSILGVALECGYDSGRSFGRAFRRFTNESPTEYRNRQIAGHAFNGGDAFPLTL